VRRIGIDVGGTNTDAVLIQDARVVHAVKTPTTADVMSGITAALAALLAGSTATAGAIDAVMIGTTHFTNAVVQRRDLSRVAAIRIGLPVSASLPPFCDWPEDLARVVEGAVYQVPGGHEFDGRPIVPFDRDLMAAVARDIAARGLTAAAISSVFSPLDPAHENAAGEILAEICPGIAITRSHDLGRIGLLERENAALLNAALADLARHTTRAFAEALRSSGIAAPLYLTQNDGTVMQAAFAEAFPVFSFASGPTNSMRGAAFLSGLSDAMVVDVGGTTSDIGMLRHGFPREANAAIRVGGVRTLFRMPDLLSIGLGGGSHVTADPLAVGPLSVGFRLPERSLVFGGDALTATDVAVAAGLLDLGDRARVAHLPAATVRAVLDRAAAMVAQSVDRMKAEAGDVPVIAVGGGAFLIPDRLEGAAAVIRVEHGAVANAVGAAIAQVSGEVDQIFQGLGRDQAIREAEAIAAERARRAGADPATLKVVDVEDLPIAYLPGSALRVRLRMVGDIQSA